MMEKVLMEVFGSGLPLSSIRLMALYPQSYILGIILILDSKLTSLTFLYIQGILWTFLMGNIK
jgi:hypothetical protein